MEKVYASFCPDCYARPKSGSKAAPRNDNPPNYALFIVLILVSILVLVGVTVLLLVSR